MKPLRTTTALQRLLFVLSLVGLLTYPSCNASRAAKGGAIGVGAGTVIGGIIGKKAGNTAVGAIIGATIGGTAGALIGRYMDKQAEKLREDLDGASVERVGEGILITFESGLLFGFDSYSLLSKTRSNLQNLSSTLQEYEDTEILVEGHTDSVGADDYNQKLSEQRAAAVVDYLVTQGIDRSRLTVKGYGETQPVESNDTDAGRAVNRRVEIAIYANDKLKKAAKKGNI